MRASSLICCRVFAFRGLRNSRSRLAVPRRRSPPSPIRATKVRPCSRGANLTAPLQPPSITAPFRFLSVRFPVLTDTTGLERVYGLRFGGKCESDPAASAPCADSAALLPAHGFLLVVAPNIIPTATRGLLCLNVNICGLGGRGGGI